MTIRERIITFNVHRLALPIVSRMTEPDLIPVPLEKLRELPEGSLGNQLGRFLTKNGFGFLPHFETHDAKHVLLNYSASAEDEASMQFFYIGNRHYSPASIVTALVSIFMMPDHLSGFISAFRRGRKTKAIGKLRLGEMLFENTTDLQKRFGIPERIVKQKNKLSHA